MPDPAPRLGAASISVQGVHKSFDGNPVLTGVDLVVAPGAVVALLGPSGCGKTTLLRLLAGLDAPDAGTIAIGDRLLSGEGTFVPPEERHTGLVFQDWALFPHLTVAENVGYGVPRGADRRQRTAAALELVGLGGFDARRPATLSGGQQQRVALARAVASEPTVLLLDEPFSNLDTTLRAQVRGELHDLLDRLGVTAVVVTHDQEEAFVLGDEVALLHDGRIVQQATPSEIYERPANRWVAGFVGDASLLRGVAEQHVARTPLGTLPLLDAVEGAVDVLLRPEQLALSGAADAGSSGAPATVEVVEYHGHDTVTVAVLDDAQRVRIRSTGSPPAAPGDRISVRHQGSPVVAFPVVSSAV